MHTSNLPRVRRLSAVVLGLVLLAAVPPAAAGTKAAQPAPADRPAEAAPAPPPETSAPAEEEPDYWLTVDSMGVRTRHVHKCRFFGNLKGRPCTRKEGRACRECGG
jgi:hypothetical protein